MEGDGAAAEKAPAADAVATSQEEPTPSSSSSTKSPFDPCISAAAAAAAATSPGEILRALQVVERDSVAIAESYASLFSSLRIALSEVTSTSLENMQCFNDVVGHLQESALDAATKGNRYINSCLRCCLIERGNEKLGKSGFAVMWKKDIKEERGQSGCGCKPSTPTSLSRHHLLAFEDEFYRSLKDAVMEVHKKDIMNCGS